MGSRLRELLLQGLNELHLELTTDQQCALLDYLDLLVKWNKAYNLSGIKNPELMVSRHLLDSLTLIPYLTGNRILDIGTGAGLPGIPLAICFPDKDFVLLDSNGKKTRFLFQVRLSLNLENVEIVNSRVEHYQSPLQIDIVISRAFSTLLKMLELTRPLFGATTKLVAMKGAFPEQELSVIPDDFKVITVDKINVPGSESERHIVEVATLNSEF